MTAQLFSDRLDLPGRHAPRYSAASVATKDRSERWQRSNSSVDK